MDRTSPSTGDPHDVMARAGGHWGMMLTFSLLTLAAGVLAVAWPGRTVHVIAVLFGIQLLVVAGYEFFRAFATDDTGIKVLRILMATFSLFAGILVLRHPFQTVALIVLVLGVLWTATGLVNMFTAISDRASPHRAPMIVGGVITFVAGIVLLSFPAPTVFAVAMLLGLMLIVVGLLGATSAFELRAATHGHRPRRHHAHHAPAL
ncbi:DUF308 domain-containing protein [Streptomyces sp. ICBB 8177]|uniref:HdeD family acid-resistance protein n=1 Tax=Streptomyces sp. ICBB 8177 TaxID=563922 RepID=UPI001305108A|nr:DUF308 domain-containing protein [Streptomyces sp. ICBB 8177]